MIKSVRSDGSRESLFIANWGKFTLEFEMLRLWVKRKETIEEWIQRDRERDHFLEDTPAPKARCEYCGKSPILREKNLESWIWEKPDRILFYFKCEPCNEVITIYDNGDVLKRENPRCPECQSKLVPSAYTKKSEGIYETTDSCAECGYTVTEKMDLRTPKKEPDPDFEKDRTRFCIPYEEASKKYYDWTSSIDQMKRVLDDITEKDEKKEVYDALNQMKKMSVKALEKFLSVELGKLGYSDFMLSKPDISKDIQVHFTMVDLIEENDRYNSVKNARAQLNTLLNDTNWVLMSEWLEYRLGIIRGKLRGIDNKDELLKLVEKRIASTNKRKPT
jgi:DNA-directed RNA polymerase subunit RPC12/RpoP